MHTLKSLVAALMLCLAFAAPSANAQIAYVDMEQIIEQMPDYKRVKSELESYQKVLQKQLQAEEKKMQDYYASVMQQMQAGTMSPAQQKEAETKLMKMQEDLAPMKDLQALTGYIRGGCSPLGMKKQFQVFIDQSAANKEWIYVNAGRRGLLFGCAPQDLVRAAKATLVDLS